MGVQSEQKQIWVEMVRGGMPPKSPDVLRKPRPYSLNGVPRGLEAGDSGRAQESPGFSWAAGLGSWPPVSKGQLQRPSEHLQEKRAWYSHEELGTPRTPG